MVAKKQNSTNPIVGWIEHPAHVVHQEVRQPLVEVEKKDGMTWINIQDGHLTDLGKIAEKYNIHSLHLHPIVNGSQLSQLVIEPNYLFILLAQPYTVQKRDTISTSPIGIYLGKDFLITMHSSRTPAPKEVFDEIRHHHTDHTLTPAQIVFHLIRHMLLSTQEQTDKVTIQLDKIENKVFNPAKSESRNINKLRQKIIRLRRSLVTQKVVLTELQETIDRFSHQDLHRYYAANTNFSHRLWEVVEEAGETVEVYKDADFTANSERTNQILAILTIIFTLSIPGTLIGSFYGMNVEVPGAITSHAWLFWGPYTTFIIICGVSILAAIGMYVWFKKKRWF